MIHFKIISIGKIKEPWITAGLEHYRKLLSKFATLEDIVVKGEKILDESQKKILLKKEAQAVLGRLKSGEPVICLDEHGLQYDSPKLADRLNHYFKNGQSTICFIIGSPLGLADEIKQRADLVLSLSQLTFPHEMAKLLLTEQLYRAMSILKGGKYHK
jgi:23S rRNA (pseudouridine1915-N3)-methyltransferase